MRLGRGARAIGVDWQESETATEAVNESLARAERREQLAVSIAQRQADDDLEVPGDMDVPRVESVDGGYWVAARIWVDAEEVEEAL